MEQEASLRILSRLVRIGTVMSVDKEKRVVRVKFQNEDMPSGWLYVLQHYDADLHIEPDGEHYHETNSAGGHNHPGSSITITQDGEHAHRTLEAYYGKERRVTHSHERSFVTWWLPKIDDAVLCLCLPTDDGDGYVLGGI